MTDDRAETTSGNWTLAVSKSRLPEGEMIGLEIEGQSLVVYRLTGDQIFATEGICTHGYALLSEGWLSEDVVECPLHGGCFNIRTGEGVCAPITEPLRTFKVRVVGDDILVALD